MNTPHDLSQRPSGPNWTALLEVSGPGGHRTSLPFRPPRVLVGRKRTNDLALPDQGVSSSHCEFVIEGGWFVVRDLASINGTFVNDRRVSEARLRDGDVVRLGGTKITVALHGSLRGAQVWSLATAQEYWKWVAALIAICCVGLVVLYFQRRAASEEQKLRQQYAVDVRALLQSDPCAAVAPHIANLQALDARIGGRPVPMAAPGHTLSPQLRDTGVELLGLYRSKAEESARALQALSTEQKEEKGAADRVGAIAQRFQSSQDKKIAYFAQGQLSERLQRGQLLLSSLTLFTQEAQRFADLVEAVSLRGDASRANELLSFRFSAKSASEQLTSCQADLARTNSGTLGAINGLAEE